MADLSTQEDNSEGGKSEPRARPLDDPEMRDRKMARDKLKYALNLVEDCLKLRFYETAFTPGERLRIDALDVALRVMVAQLGRYGCK